MIYINFKLLKIFLMNVLKSYFQIIKIEMMRENHISLGFSFLRLFFSRESTNLYSKLILNYYRKLNFYCFFLQK